MNTIRKHLFSLFVLSILLAASAKAEEEATPKGKLVFVAMTGPEDLATLASSFRHATAAQKSGRLEEVVWLAWGRAVLALDPTVSAISPEVKEQARMAREAGVRLVACGQALQKWGIQPDKLDPSAEVVPNGVDELARLVSRGYEAIRY
ncbi:MAG: DsrE family protein [Pseudomonadota bacterium]|nr:MAG: hypothetical protein DIU72_06630 [Pseudomonadota bacterium]